MLYVLLQRKTQKTYMRMWNAIAGLVPTIQPRILMMDFETAASNAAGHIFGEQLEVKYCLFFPALVSKCSTELTFSFFNASNIQKEYSSYTYGNCIELLILSFQVKYCFFHLCQSLWRHVQMNPAVLKAYLASAESTVRLYVKMLCALAYLPPDAVRGGFDDLRQSADFPQQLNDIYK